MLFAGMERSEYDIERVQKVLHVLETVPDIFLEAFQDKLRKAFRHVWPEVFRVGRLFLDMLHRDFDGLRTGKRQAPAGHFKKDDA